MKKILVVDDCPTVLDMMQYLLEGLGYEVTTASSGPEAYALLKKTKFSLIFTDLIMPEMDGIQFTAEAKKLPNCRFVPIVMFSAEQDEGRKKEAKEIGIATFLQKPIKDYQLKTILNVVLGP